MGRFTVLSGPGVFQLPIMRRTTVLLDVSESLLWERPQLEVIYKSYVVARW